MQKCGKTVGAVARVFADPKNIETATVIRNCVSLQTDASDVLTCANSTYLVSVVAGTTKELVISIYGNKLVVTCIAVQPVGAVTGNQCVIASYAM